MPQTEEKRLITRYSEVLVPREITAAKPILLAPLNRYGLRLGLPVALGTDGFPANRQIVLSGKTSAGKTTVSHAIAALYDLNGDAVRVYETEHRQDPYLMGSLFTHKIQGLPRHEVLLHALPYLRELTISALREAGETVEPPAETGKKKTAKFEAKDAGDNGKKLTPLVTPREIETMKQRIPLIDALLADLHAGKSIEPYAGPDKNRVQKLIDRAVSEYCVRDVVFHHVTRIELLEECLLNEMDHRAKNIRKLTTRWLGIVDSMNLLMTEEDQTKAFSSDGTHFPMPRYMADFLKRISGPLAELEMSLILIYHLKERVGFDSIALHTNHRASLTNLRSGGTTKFTASFLGEVQYRKGGTNLAGEPCDRGVLTFEKASLRGGSDPTLKGEFLIIHRNGETLVDFDEPFIQTALDNKMFGIQKNNGGYYYLPDALLQGHPRYEALRAEMRTAKDIGLPGLRDTHAEALFYGDYLKGIVLERILWDSPAFLEAVQMHYRLATTV